MSFLGKGKHCVGTYTFQLVARMSVLLAFIFGVSLDNDYSANLRKGLRQCSKLSDILSFPQTRRTRTIIFPWFPTLPLLVCCEEHFSSKKCKQVSCYVWSCVHTNAFQNHVNLLVNSKTQSIPCLLPSYYRPVRYRHLGLLHYHSRLHLR